MNQKIKLTDLLNYTLKTIPLQGLYELEHIIEELGLNMYSMLDEQLDKSLFLIKEIYDNPHNSDEQSYRSLLFFKNRFCCLFGKTGDRGGVTVEFASNEIANELRMYLISLEENTYSIIKEEEMYLSDHYTFFFEKEGSFYYKINSPKWSYCFANNIDNLYYVRDENLDDLVKCKFLSYKDNKKKSYEDKEEDKYMWIKLETGEKLLVEYYRVIFKV